ncbi:hypothetical protein [Nocardioides zeae]|uniref:Anti-sigma factor n=1 Tax=Nocardioides zeae TaxID=1457234 RepID=A0A6P0HPI2_9ACTN|nr:hypothetical protein [Nocardioides zeae]NEN80147.1 hypothetical protein [Nocardioides zeae]
MSTSSERRAELVAGAVTGHLDEAEQAELDALVRDDPSVALEIEELRAVSERIGALGAWEEPLPSSAVGAPRRRRTLIAAAAALVAGVGLGTAGTLVVQQTGDEPARTATTGPPGTLGVAEPVRFEPATGAPAAAAEVRAEVIPHTWGTEAVLDVEGLAVGETYDVRFLDAEGSPVSAGAFLGSAVEIHCSLNAAVLREDVVTLQIVGPDGELVRSADLPTVAG